MATKAKQLQTTIVQFYQQPIAKVSLELFLSIAAVMFFALFAIRPTLLTMAELVKEIDDKEKLAEQMDQKIAALSSVQTEFLSVESRLPILDEAIPLTPQFENALKIVEKLASDNKLVISSIRVEEIPQEPSETPEYDGLSRVSLPMSVTVTGDYPAIRQFVEEVRQVRRTLVVESIVFTVSDQRNQKRLSATITINVNYYGQSTKKP
jgi:Tfp pilus assembly protein PilO